MLVCLLVIGTAWAGDIFDLPKPQEKGALSLEEVLFRRRSIREFAERPLALSQLSQLLFACQGQTSVSGRRTAPSAGALYPLDLYALVGRVEGLPSGLYRYDPGSHRLLQTMKGDRRERLSRACLGQSWVREAPVSFVIVGVYGRTTAKYGERGKRYVQIEAGHAAQNLLLQATALGLGSCPIGAFHDEEVKEVVGLREAEEPLYVICVGRGRP